MFWILAICSSAACYHADQVMDCQPSILIWLKLSLFGVSFTPLSSPQWWIPCCLVTQVLRSEGREDSAGQFGEWKNLTSPALFPAGGSHCAQCTGTQVISTQVTTLGFQGPPAAKIWHLLNHHSDAWLWIWILKKRQDHFNPHAANHIANSSQSLLNPYGVPSEVQVFSDIASFNLHDSCRGICDGHYPQVTDEETGADRELNKHARGYSGNWWQKDSTLAPTLVPLTWPLVLSTVCFTLQYV